MSKKILVIDDDIQIRMMLREVLEDSGFEVFDAENGEVGISLYKANKPDLVVTDMIMPEKEGIGTLMELIAYDPDLKAIAISGGGKVVKATDVLKDAAFFGAKLVLTKPFTCEEFLNAIKQVLGID